MLSVPPPVTGLAAGTTAAVSPGETRPFPKPWQRVLATDHQGKPHYGTVTFSCATFCEVLFHGEARETTFFDPAKLHWSADDHTGLLPLAFFLKRAPQSAAGGCQLAAQNYDLVLVDGERVSNCFFKESVFLEIAGGHRYIPFAHIAQLRPSE